MAGRGGAIPGSGRKPGVPNKKTQERLLELALAGHEAQKRGRKLAIHILDDFMHLCAGMAAVYQPAPPNAAPNTNMDEAKFWQCVYATRDFAKALAKHQSPTFRAISVQVGPDTPPQTIDLKVNGENVIPLTKSPEELTRIYKRRIVQVR